MDPIFNMVSISTFQFADATPDGSDPTTLIPIRIIEEGKFNPDFKPGTQTVEYDEKTQLPFRVRKGPDTWKINVSISKASLTEAAAFLGGDANANTFKVDSTSVSPNPKYLKITGYNLDGKLVTFICYKAFVATSWSGAVGANQATVPLAVEGTLVMDNAPIPKLINVTVAS